MRFSLRALFLPLTLVAIGLGWRYRGRVDFCFDPPTPILAVLIPAIGAAVGAGVAALARRQQKMVDFAIVFAIAAVLVFSLVAARLYMLR